jgi:GSH-dependent disulfide-bond oxidoreductase
MSIELYTWSTPNGKKISIALEEMGLAYNVHPINIGKDEQFAPDFLKISPNNKIPAIVDTDNGQPVFESGAILMYLGDKSGKFYPNELVKRINPGKAPFAEEMFAKEAQRLYGVLNAQLGKMEFVAGDYSIADMAIFPWAARFEWQRVDLNSFPHVKRWYQAISARPAVVKGFDVPVGGARIPMPKELTSA